MKRSIFLVWCMMVIVALASASRAASASNLPISDYLVRIETDLTKNILPYWLEHARDRERGGFYGEVDDHRGIQKDAPRGALLTARVLWTYSAAYRIYHKPEYLEMARWAYADLWARFWDKEHGGLYWSVSAAGVPLDARKVIYVEAFGIYSLAEFNRATGEAEPLERAKVLYRLLEEHSHDRKNLGYFEEFSRDWKKLRARGDGGSAMGSLGQKSQNVHLHLLEAYANLLRVWPDAELKKNLREMADVLLTRIVDPSNHHLRLFLEENWMPQSDTISYGHDIEFSWLVVEAAELIGDEKFLADVKREAVKIADATLKEGVDKEGGIVAEGGPHGVTNRSKEWWPQAEATVGFINAYQISRQPEFLEASLRTWDFIDQHLIDHKNGEWFGGLRPNGRPDSTVKISFWKCPYHNGRACMEMVERLRAVNGAADGKRASE